MEKSPGLGSNPASAAFRPWIVMKIELSCMESTWHAAGAQDMRANVESGGQSRASKEANVMLNQPAMGTGFLRSLTQRKHWFPS